MLAQAGVGKLDHRDAVQREAGQRLALVAGDQVGSGRRRPDAEQLFGSHLVGRVPVRDAAPLVARQDLVLEADVALQFRALPVRPDRLVSALLGERRVAVDALRGEQRGELVLVACLPGALVAGP